MRLCPFWEERLEQLGYKHLVGTDLERSHKEVVFKDSLETTLRRRYPELPDASLKETVARFSRPQGADLIRRNLDFHQLLTRGFEVPVENPDGSKEFRHIHAIDWENPEANDFLVVNQLPVHGQNDRRPDLVIYVNGFPLALFELKNPYDPNPTVEHALNQIAHYRNDIPQVFEFNALTVVSDGITTLHGMWSASMEWFADLAAYSVAFVSIGDNLDLSTPAGRLMFQIIGAMAEFERVLIQERVRAGMRNARAKGTRLGRPPVLVNTSELARLRADGWGWKRIARHMGLGVSTVLRAMDGCRPPRKGTEKVSAPMSAIA